MSRATRLGLALVGSGVVLGLVADALLRETPLGLNAFLWTTAFAGAAAALVRWQRQHVRSWLLLPFLGFGALLLWRDSHWLAVLNLFGAAVALSLAAAPAASFRLRIAGATEYALAGFAALGAAVGGAAMTLFDEIGWKELRHGSRAERFAQVVRGLALALPLLAVFGGLFVAADAVFADLARDLAPANARTPIVHVLVVAAWAWLAIGLLRRFLLTEGEPAPFEEPRPRTLGLGVLELGVVLALVDLLFLAFVLVQLRYLFGGSGRVASETGLTYAEYARHGFFELVVAAALVLPLLLGADWALRRDRAGGEWMLRALSALLVVLVFVVMASALQRMRLYQRAYGLTELRVYATGFMVWLAALLGWACATVLRGRRERFAFGALVAGFAAIATMNALDPDALIARTNIERARSGGQIDFRYLQGLSDDAVPALLEALPTLEPRVRARLAANLLARRGDDDWRTWNWSRTRADMLLDEHRAALVEMR